MNDPHPQIIQPGITRRDQPPPVIRLPESNPLQMLANALARGIDNSQLEKLMDLADRYEKNEARKAYVAAMAAFKLNAPSILKDKHVKYKTRDGDLIEYDHASLGAVTSAVVEGLAKVGISHRWDVKQNAGVVHVTCILTHELGHSEQGSLESGVDNSGKKNPIQQMASAVSYLQRYTLLSVAGLATNDGDDDGRETGGEDEVVCITDKQVADLEALMAEWKTDRAAMLSYYRIDALTDIPLSSYDRICREVLHKGKLKAADAGRK